MGGGTITLGAAALVGLSAMVMRLRISRNWINASKIPTEDLTGKVIVITGANTGLGFEAALDLARRKATVVIGCRDVGKGQEAVDLIKKKTGNTNVECIELDLASLQNVRAFATTIISKYPKIHALVCNAGVLVPMEEKTKTKDGLEIHFGVNHLAHFELVERLLAHLASMDDEKSRIVFVSSSLSEQGKLNLETQDFVRDGRQEEEETEKGDGQNKKSSIIPTGYSDSKLMNAMACKHLDTLLPSHITTYAVCPGFCRSSLGRHVEFPWYKKMMIGPVFLMIQRTAVQGAQNILFCTLEDKDKLQSGAMYRDGVILTSVMDHMASFGMDAPKKLWDISEKLSREIK